MEDSRQLGGLDHWRLWAAFLVVAIHTSPLASFSDGADFLLTRVVARTAVPFFLMVTGFFLLPPHLFGKGQDQQPLLRFFRRTALLYAAAILLYLPVNLYAGQLEGLHVWDVLRMLVFDGTFYHLWYLPASMLGVLLVVLLSRRLPFGAVAGISAALYAICLLGDSYYGFFAPYTPFRTVFDALFRISSYTRNGLFYAPIFLVLGAGLARIRPRSRRFLLAGLLVCAALMITEGLMLHRLDVQRHDSAYLSLPLCMFFLFQLVATAGMRPAKPLRTLAAGIYLLHPWCILLVRAGAKLLGLERLFIENSIIHYLSVCLLSAACAGVVTILLTAVRRRPSPTGRAWIEVDLDCLRGNVNTLRALLPPGCQLMPAIKANAYGHGAVPIARELNRLGVRAFCVASVPEGVQLRRRGIRGEILVLGYTHPEQFPLLRRYRLTQTVVDAPYAQLLNSYGKKLRVHLKLDTGMHRLGQRAEQIDQLCSVFRCPNLVVTGTFTHLCCADTDSPPDRTRTEAQGHLFHQTVAALEQRGFSCGKLHLLASNGLLHYPQLGGDYARVGIALYGVLSDRAALESTPAAHALRPVLSLKARVALTKPLRAGEGAGYGLQHVAHQDQTIAVLTIGYADGLPRALSCGRGKVLIHGMEAPIIGRICMDQTLVDVTHIPQVRSGDVATLLGVSGEREITAYDLAEEAGTITNEILSRLGSRLDRIVL